MAGRWHARQDKNGMKSFILTHHGRPLACKTRQKCEEKSFILTHHGWPLACKNRQKCDEIIYINTPWPAAGMQDKTRM